LIERFGELNHSERRLAVGAMVNHIKRAKRPDALHTRQLLLRLFRHRPRIALPAAWSLLSANLVGGSAGINRPS
jgi:hypothetical protein